MGPNKTPPILLTQKDFKKMPWKNGGGVTTEIYRIPHPSSPDSFLFRLSMAKVEKDGPFSLFPQINRTLMLVEGQGFLLKFPSEEVLLDQKLVPFHFSGEDQVECHLIQGPCIDFNVMIDSTWGKTNTSVFTPHLSDPSPYQVKATTDYQFIFDLSQKELFILQKNDIYQLSPHPLKNYIVVDLKTSHSQ